MSCTCSETWIKTKIKERGHSFNAEHSPGCDKRSQAARDVAFQIAVNWFTQTEPCSGPAYAHPPHGGCPGYSRDRT